MGIKEVTMCCDTCGKPLSASWKFCPQCGTRILSFAERAITIMEGVAYKAISRAGRVGFYIQQEDAVAMVRKAANDLRNELNCSALAAAKEGK